MTKLFIDDKRDFEEAKNCGYQCVRTYNQCITLLSIFKNITTIHLDYDLGTKETGFDILLYMKEHNIKVKEIYIHSTHLEGVQKMEEFIKQHFKDVTYVYSPYYDK